MLAERSGIDEKQVLKKQAEDWKVHDVHRSTRLTCSVNPSRREAFVLNDARTSNAACSLYTDYAPPVVFCAVSHLPFPLLFSPVSV